VSAHSAVPELLSPLKTAAKCGHRLLKESMLAILKNNPATAQHLAQLQMPEQQKLWLSRTAW